MPIHGIAWGRKSLWSRLSGLGLIGLVLVLILSACGGGGPTNNPQVITQHIKHIVFFVKENRTFDNYFGTYPGANGATSAMDSEGNVVPLPHEARQQACDQDVVLALLGAVADLKDIKQLRHALHEGAHMLVPSEVVEKVVEHEQKL